MKKKSIIFLATFFFFLITCLLFCYYPVYKFHLYDAGGNKAVNSSLKLLEENSAKYDVIFIGDSRSKYQINPAVGFRKNILSFNAGINGYYYPYWASIIKHVPANKTIVFSLPVGSFYQPFETSSMDIYASLSSVPFIYKVVSSSYLFQYIKSAFMNIKPPIENLALFKKNLFHLSTLLEKKHTKALMNNDVECTISAKNKAEEVFNCNDNTGYIKTYIFPSKEKTKIFANNNLNSQILEYFQRLITYAHQRNIKVGFILVPRYGSDYQVDISQISSSLKCPVLNLTNFLIDRPNLWESTGAHLNVEGREIYSEQVFNWLVSQKASKLFD